MYQLNEQDGYIVSLAKNVSEGNISEEEYNEIIEICRNAPKAPEGFTYRLKTNLEWELCELPLITEEEEELSAEEALAEILEVLE